MSPKRCQKTLPAKLVPIHPRVSETRNWLSINTIFFFIKSILKSLLIPAIWLALSSVIYSQSTAFFFALNHICSKSRHSCSKSHRFFLKSHHFCFRMHQFCFKHKMRCKNFFISAFQQTSYLVIKLLLLTELCDFKMDVIKW